jgi:response regulator RpfG family c-di-GMP phosphodiesterase
MISPDHPTLLLVDDEPDLLLSLEGLLRQEFRLFTAGNGSEALRIVRTETIHVIMSDQRMPDMTGDELLAHVAKESPSTIRILLTGYADIQDVIRALNTGGLFRYLTKPWDLDELLAVLRDAVVVYSQHQNRQQQDAEKTQFTHDILEFLEAQPQSDQVTRLIEHGQRLLDFEAADS